MDCRASFVDSAYVVLFLKSGATDNLHCYIYICSSRMERAIVIGGVPMSARSIQNLAATKLLEGCPKGFIVNLADLPWK